MTGQVVSIEGPRIDLFANFMEFAQEMKELGETLWDGYYPTEGDSPRDFIERQVRRETNPEAPLVPETVYWGTVDGHVVGRISLRHRLDGHLVKIGGHIGYEVRPSYRRKGIAKEMLRQVLLTPKAREIGRLLLTCSPDNMASNKTILANNGVLTQTIYVELVKANKNHYWIDVTQGGQP